MKRIWKRLSLMLLSLVPVGQAAAADQPAGYTTAAQPRKSLAETIRLGPPSDWPPLTALTGESCRGSAPDDLPASQGCVAMQTAPISNHLCEVTGSPACQPLPPP